MSPFTTVAFALAVTLVVRAVFRKQKRGAYYPAVFLSPKHKLFLEKHFPFYSRLPQQSKMVFSRRVAVFMTSKKFIPRNLPLVTWQMKVLISASAVQLTFGFPRIHLSHFRYILVYPDIYYSPSGQNHHKGEVNPKAQAIVLSWKHFVEGYLEKDGRNLGLHEMAHALRLENRIMNHEYRFLNDEVLREWELRATRTMEEIIDGREDFFRKYGAENREEFFSVAVENFFERPQGFSDKHPKLYKTMAALLKQDPLMLA